METSETQETGQKPRPEVRRQSPSSSPDTDQDSDFVLVPNSLAGDSSRNKNMHAGVSPMTARRIGSRPGSLPVISKGHSAEPIPVPTQKAAYAAIQNSLIRSKAAGISAPPSGASLGPSPAPDIISMSP